MEHVLEVRSLVHRYGERVAVDGVDLTVAPGEIVALLGPNGAGKTTLVRNVIGLVRGESGAVRVAGGDPKDARIRRRMGVVQQSVGFPRSLTVGESVIRAAARKGKSAAEARSAVTEMGLPGLGGGRAGKLSGGQQQRLQLAMGLVSDPILLVLDEPTEGLDVEARRRFWATIQSRRADGAGVLVTTHLVEEAASIADRVVVLDEGRIVAVGTPDELRRRLPGRRVEAWTTIPIEEIRSLDGVHSAARRGERTVITTTDSETVVRALLDLDPGARDLTVATATLEDALVAITHHEEMVS